MRRAIVRTAPAINHTKAPRPMKPTNDISGPSTASPMRHDPESQRVIE
jgi:hypothetical protein